MEILQYVLFIFEIIVSPILGVIIEYKFQIIQKIKKIYHKLRNSKTEFTLNVIYEANIEFSHLKLIVKENFRNKFEKIKVLKDDDGNLEILVNNLFNLTLFKSPNNEIGFLTSKVQSGLANFRIELDEIITVLDSIQSIIQKRRKIFREKEAGLDLYLPFEKVVPLRSTPKGVELKDYEVEYVDKKFSSILKIRLGFLRVDSTLKTNLEKSFSKII